jgi:hypothetical protein
MAATSNCAKSSGIGFCIISSSWRIIPDCSEKSPRGCEGWYAPSQAGNPAQTPQKRSAPAGRKRRIGGPKGAVETAPMVAAARLTLARYGFLQDLPDALHLLLTRVFLSRPKNPRSPSFLRRGTTWMCTCGTDWLTRLLMATKAPSQPNALSIAVAIARASSKRTPAISAGRSERCPFTVSASIVCLRRISTRNPNWCQKFRGRHTSRKIG